jgi:WD40 repeat protein
VETTYLSKEQQAHLLQSAPFREAIIYKNSDLLLSPLIKKFLSRCVEPVKRFKHAEYIKSLAISPDGSKLLTGSSDHTVKLWDIQSGAVLHTFNHQLAVESVAFSHDGSKIITGSDDRTAKVWDTQSGIVLHTLQHGHRVCLVTFNKDDSQIITGSDDRTVKVWDAYSGNPIHTFDNDRLPRVLAVSPDGAQVLTGSSLHRAMVWSSLSGDLIHTLYHRKSILENTNQGISVWSVAFSADGSRYLTGCLDGTAVLWDAKSGELIRLFEHGDEGVYTVGFSLDGSTIITGSGGKGQIHGTLKVWDIDSGKLLKVINTTLYRVLRFVLVPGEAHILMVGDKEAEIRDMQTEKLIYKFTPLMSDKVAALSPDGSLLATGAGGWTGVTADLWNIKELINNDYFLSHLNIDQLDLFRGFELTFTQKDGRPVGRIQATHDQWNTFMSLPPTLQKVLNIRIKAPGQIGTTQQEQGIIGPVILFFRDYLSRLLDDYYR